MLAERVVDWTKQWKQEGLEEGLETARQLLVRLAELRFGGDCAATLGPLLTDIEDQALLIRIGEWIIQSPDGATLISRAQALRDDK